jgi:hypothetical protein
VVGIALTLLALLAWALHRLSFGAMPRRRRARAPRRPLDPATARAGIPMILPLAHHNAIQALPVFAPMVVVCIVLAVRFIRDRRNWEADEKR